MCPLMQTFINAHLAVYLIWRRDSAAKGAKKNSSPNVIRLQYLISVEDYEERNRYPGIINAGDGGLGSV